MKKSGFEVIHDSGGMTVARRNGCAATVEDCGDGKVAIGKAGVLVGGEIAHLVHGGYQMFLRTRAGREIPAQADQLKALHAFDSVGQPVERWPNVQNAAYCTPQLAGMTGPILNLFELRKCMRKGATVGWSPDATEEARRNVRAQLAEFFRKP